MRQALVLTLALMAVVALGCGDGSGLAGTYTLDKGKMKELMQKSQGGTEMESALEGVPAEAREAMGGMMDQMVQALENMEVELVVSADGTFTGTSSMMGQKDTSTGTWTKSGDIVTFVTKHEDGQGSDEPDSMRARYKDGTLTLIPDEGEQMPFEMVLHKK